MPYGTKSLCNLAKGTDEMTLQTGCQSRPSNKPKSQSSSKAAKVEMTGERPASKTKERICSKVLRDEDEETDDEDFPLNPNSQVC